MNNLPAEALELNKNHLKLQARRQISPAIAEANTTSLETGDVDWQFTDDE